jgi:hypothetical protein
VFDCSAGRAAGCAAPTLAIMPGPLLGDSPLMENT